MSQPNDQSLIEAARNGDVEDLQHLIPLASLAGRNLALQWAAEEGQSRCVSVLIPYANPKDRNSWALVSAAKNGHAHCVKLLIPVSDPNADGAHALLAAVERNRLECVKLLLPVSSALHYDSDALQIAACKGYTALVDLLFEHSNAQDALTHLQFNLADEPQVWAYLEDKVAQQQRTMLYGAIETVERVKPRKM